MMRKRKKKESWLFRTIFPVYAVMSVFLLTLVGGVFAYGTTGSFSFVIIGCIAGLGIAIGILYCMKKLSHLKDR